MAQPDYSETWELLHRAVMTLATGDGSPRERLLEAYTESILVIPDSAVPPEISSELAGVNNAFERVSPIDRSGSAAPSAIALDDEELWDLVRRIVGMYARVEKYSSDDDIQ